MKTKLSTLWIFATLNYLYCDVLGLMDPNLLEGYLAGTVNGLEVSQAFLLAAGILVEIPMALVVVSRLAKYGLNRWANVIAGAIMTIVQIATLFAGTPTIYYVFFSVIEVATTGAIVWLAWRWAEDQRAQIDAASAPGSAELGLASKS